MRSLTFHHSAGLERRPRAGARGFTMLELMTVVIIIGVLMVIAVPGIAHRMDEYRSMQTANEIAAVYRNARMRALARGSAVTVRFNATAQSFDVLESVEGGVSTCARRPSTSCVTANQQLVNRVVLGGDRAASMIGPADAIEDEEGEPAAALDVCFSPVGATRFRPSNNSTLQVSPMTGVAQVIVSRQGGAVGLTRNVLVLPNGTARVVVPTPQLGTP